MSDGLVEKWMYRIVCVLYFQCFFIYDWLGLGVEIGGEEFGERLVFVCERLCRFQVYREQIEL